MSSIRLRAFFDILHTHVKDLLNMCMKSLDDENNWLNDNVNLVIIFSFEFFISDLLKDCDHSKKKKKKKKKKSDKNI